MKDGIRSEARQLPLILGKLIGGLICVIGFGGLVFILTRPPKPSLFSILSFAIAAIAGIVLFAYCSRIMALRVNKQQQEPTGKKSFVSRALPWVILVVLAAIFIVVMLLISP